MFLLFMSSNSGEMGTMIVRISREIVVTWVTVIVRISREIVVKWVMVIGKNVQRDSGLR